MNSLINRAGWLVAGVLGLLVVAALSGVVRGGPLDPPGPPGPTQPIVEPRTPISSLPYSINASGSYFLTKNLSLAGGTGITINADDVTVDLNGFTLSGVNDQGAGIGTTAGFKSNIVVRNGTVQDWAAGIYLPLAVRGAFDDLEVASNGTDGLVVGSGTTIARVRSHSNGASGITLFQQAAEYGNTVVDSNVISNGGSGIVVGANNTWLHHNVIDANGHEGILATSDYNRITDNEITGNGTAPANYFGIRLDGPGADTSDHNIVARNFIVLNDVVILLDSFTNRIGPSVNDTALSTSNPWSNVGY